MPRVNFTVGLAIRGPIAPGTYEVGRKSITVSYPASVALGGQPTPLPIGRSTVFVVDWEDRGGKTAALLQSSGYQRHLVIHRVLDAISELLVAFKLVRVGHVDGLGLRTVGIGDTLFHFSKVDGRPSGNLNVCLRSVSTHHGQIDPFGTTDLALPHIGTGTMPVARRYVRCFELIEHGFYTEAFLAAFAVLDDQVQQVLSAQLFQRGLGSEAERKELMRGIKEDRLRMYLGPLLRIACGTDIQSMWPLGLSALQWLNSTRNRIAHAAESIEQAAAYKAVFVCLKVLVCLRDAGLLSLDLPVEVFREAKLKAAWTLDPPDWVPSGALAESMDFAS